MKKQLTLFLCLLLFIPMYGYAEDEVNHQIVQRSYEKSVIYWK